jgi:hypothetical protein
VKALSFRWVTMGWRVRITASPTSTAGSLMGCRWACVTGWTQVPVNLLCMCRGQFHWMWVGK